MRPSTLLALASVLLLGLAVGCSSTGAPPSGAQSPGGGPDITLPTTPVAQPIALSETGSTLLYPLLSAWASAYHRQFAQVTVPTAATGSGAGITAASAGKVSIGASDAYLSSGDLVTNPDLLNIPLAISAQQIDYNVPELPRGTNIRLNGAVLAQMYQGLIGTWNDPAIAALNPGVALPALRVVPLHRSDSSGDTFLFSSYLATDDAGWNSAIGYGTTLAWPAAAGARAEMGNSGMVAGCTATPGCVAYIGISYLSRALAAGLGEAQLANASGRYELPTAASMTAAAASFVSLLPAGETISMVNGPAAAGYPIVNYEYAIVTGRQPDAATAHDLQAFLHWAITTGNSASFLDQVSFQPLPDAVVSLADAQIALIK